MHCVFLVYSVVTGMYLWASLQKGNIARDTHNQNLRHVTLNATLFCRL